MCVCVTVTACVSLTRSQLTLLCPADREISHQTDGLGCQATGVVVTDPGCYTGVGGRDWEPGSGVDIDEHLPHFTLHHRHALTNPHLIGQAPAPRDKLIMHKSPAGLGGNE